MKYYRIHEKNIAWATGKPRGVFVAVWKLLDCGLFSDEEKMTYYENKERFEEILPVPPFYAEGNPDKAITWYKNTFEGNGIANEMDFYFSMARKYGLELFITETDRTPGKVIYEDDYQIAVVDSIHEGEGYTTVRLIL